MFAEIVAGTDGSDTAAGAVALAVDLAQRCGANLHLVSAYQDPATSVAVAHTGAVAVPDTSLTAFEVQSSCEELLADVAKQAGSIPVTHAVPGAPADVLISVAESVGADLIVVGSERV